MLTANTAKDTLRCTLPRLFPCFFKTFALLPANRGGLVLLRCISQLCGLEKWPHLQGLRSGGAWLCPGQELVLLLCVGCSLCL